MVAGQFRRKGRLGNDPGIESAHASDGGGSVVRVVFARWRVADAELTVASACSNPRQIRAAWQSRRVAAAQAYWGNARHAAIPRPRCSHPERTPAKPSAAGPAEPGLKGRDCGVALAPSRQPAASESGEEEAERAGFRDGDGNGALTEIRARRAENHVPARGEWAPLTE
jgi:hypothetical protein